MDGINGMVSAQVDKMDPQLAAFMQRAKECIEDLGLRQFQIQLADFIDCMVRLNDLNREFTDSAFEAGSTEEQDLIVRIAKGTQEYYSYLSKANEKMRRLFLEVTAFADSTQVIEQLGKLTGQTLDLKIPPMISIHSIRPQNYIMQLDAISNQLATLQEKNTLSVGGRGTAPIRTTVTLDIPEHMKLDGGQALSTYDKSVLNGVTTMLECGNTVFSIPMLYHAMTGKSNPTVDEALQEELSTKLEQMRRMMISIDLTQESEAHFFRDESGEIVKVEDLTLEGYLLPLNKVSGTVNGKKTELYQIIQHPPLYTYSKMKRQLSTVHISLLDAPVNNNATTIPLKTYLLQRVELMKNKKNTITSTVILYDSIYRELGALEANKTRKMRIRTYTTTILQHFADQGYIDSYSEFKRGRSIAGINIEF